MLMNRFAVLALVCLALTSFDRTYAAAPARTFVATTGNDANPCTLVAPCRGFQAAINAVAAGGEVVALDSGGYGAMEIHKSVSVIVPPGVHAGLSPATGIPLPGFPGQSTVVLIDIESTDTVVLRGLNINHQGSVTGGIDWLSANGGTVHVENTVVNGFPNEGVFMATAGGTMYIKDSIVRNNRYGIYARGNAVVSNKIFADRARVENSTWAVTFEGWIAGWFRDVAITGSQIGVYLTASGGVIAQLYVDHCAVTRNDTGVLLNASATGDGTYLTAAGSVFLDNYDHVIKSGMGFKTINSVGNNSWYLNFDYTVSPK
jgi:hypothetical protein